mmetsp:Transcript_9129/g.30257  ORF Transcript_9129/g.30257 Transcript_9129/m.30257 type:complete len:227 (-) Transcript_9129:639-1319(-)
MHRRVAVRRECEVAQQVLGRLFSQHSRLGDQRLLRLGQLLALAQRRRLDVAPMVRLGLDWRLSRRLHRPLHLRIQPRLHRRLWEPVVDHPRLGPVDDAANAWPAYPHAGRANLCATVAISEGVPPAGLGGADRRVATQLRGRVSFRPALEAAVRPAAAALLRCAGRKEGPALYVGRRAAACRPRVAAGVATPLHRLDRGSGHRDERRRLIVVDEERAEVDAVDVGP